MADPETIYNWRRLDDRITTSGQPTEPQLADIHALGVRHVVNLVPRCRNWRMSWVSAFFYRYRRDVLGMDETQARGEMEAIWHPEGVWAAFVDR